jgi:hypothetical protein
MEAAQCHLLPSFETLGASQRSVRTPAALLHHDAQFGITNRGPIGSADYLRPQDLQRLPLHIHHSVEETPNNSSALICLVHSCKQQRM